MLFVSPGWAASDASGRLTGPVHPTAQHVALALDPAGTTYAGVVEIALAVEAPTDRFTLHAEGLTLGAAWLTIGHRAIPVVLQPDGSRVSVRASRTLKPGPATLTMAFDGTYSRDVGLYRGSEDGVDYLVTQLEPDEARTAWPAFDEPRFKIPWTLVVEAPASQVVLSNTDVASRTIDGDRQTVTFETTPALSSYLVALGVGPFESVPLAEGRRGAVWTLPGKAPRARDLAEVVPRHAAFLEDWFAEPCPYPKIDFLLVPHFTYGAMENPGLVIGADQLLLTTPDATPDERSAARFVAAHELAHFWFGDLVTLAWWDELWLNEAFADWMAAKAEAALQPAMDGRADQLASTSGSLAQDGLAGARPLTTAVDPDHVFETANLFQAYSKGGAILDAVEAWIGPDTFRAGLRTHVDRFAGGVVTLEDLVAALSEASGRDVGAVLGPYVTAPGAPRLDFAKDEAGRWSVSRTRLAALGTAEAPREAPWVVPLHLEYGAPGGLGVTDVLVGDDVTPLPALDGARWVFPTPDAVGYFVWSQPRDATAALLTDPLRPLSPLERQGVVSNLERLREVGAVDLAEELDLLQPFRDERSPAVVAALLDPWDVAWAHRPPGRDEEMAALLRDALGPTLLALGHESRPDDGASTPRLRARLLTRLGADARDPAVLAWARERTEAFLADPSSAERSLVGAALAVAAKHGDDTLQGRLLDAWSRTADPGLKGALLQAIGAVPTDTARERALALALAEPALEPGDRLSLVGAAFPDEAHGDARLDWAMAHHDALVGFVPPPFRIYLATFGGGCDPARFARARAFYGAPERTLPGLESVLAQTGQGVEACVAQRARNQPAVTALLDARR